MVNQTKYQHVSDIVIEAFENKTLEILLPILQKYDKLYIDKVLIGNVYFEYINKISTEYHSAVKKEKTTTFK